ncbi:MAG: hypothetical protein LQ347_004516 [Umbilicaria vellea]|nr:MAG: hypothetical protein LQ347_004516 [Umbilicaria vellea]
MSFDHTSPTVGEDFEKQEKVTPIVVEHDSSSTLGKGEIFSLQDVDPALNAKMHLVNNLLQAIDQIGWTGYHYKLFVLNGFGYVMLCVASFERNREKGNIDSKLPADYSCATAATCTKANNMGWRYLWFTCGAIVFMMSIARITVIRLKETPKYLLGEGKDEEVAKTLQWMAAKYSRPCSLTAAELTACGIVGTSKSTRGKFSINEIMVHLRGLFLTRKIGWSTTLVWLSWTLIGLAYPLYNVFLPQYLKSRGAETGSDSNYIIWRNYAIIQMCGIWGPVLAGLMCEVKFIGRKGTMVIGALVTMAFFFAYTQVRTAAQNLGFNCAITFCLNIYYGCLYAYTPEVMPSAHRATGNGLAVSFNRIMGIVSAVVGIAANTSTAVPIFICAALYILMAVVAILLPFEPQGRRSA